MSRISEDAKPWRFEPSRGASSSAGTPVVIYPVIGSDDWRDDETLDPRLHIFSELVPGTFADYVAVPKRNAIVLPEGESATA